MHALFSLFSPLDYRYNLSIILLFSILLAFLDILLQPYNNCSKCRNHHSHYTVRFLVIFLPTQSFLVFTCWHRNHVRAKFIFTWLLLELARRSVSRIQEEYIFLRQRINVGGKVTITRISPICSVTDILILWRYVYAFLFFCFIFLLCFCVTSFVSCHFARFLRVILSLLHLGFVMV